MQYIAGNITLYYFRVTPNAPSPVGGGGVSEMLLDIRTLYDNLLQQNGQCGFDDLASSFASISSSTTSFLI